MSISDSIHTTKSSLQKKKNHEAKFLFFFSFFFLFFSFEFSVGIVIREYAYHYNFAKDLKKKKKKKNCMRYTQGKNGLFYYHGRITQVHALMGRSSRISNTLPIQVDFLYYERVSGRSV